jgi:hypothetical protein
MSFTNCLFARSTVIRLPNFGARELQWSRSPPYSPGRREVGPDSEVVAISGPQDFSVVIDIWRAEETDRPFLSTTTD